MPPVQSLCPRCGLRPRRLPGSPCTPCSVEDNRRRRLEKHHGTVKRVRLRGGNEGVPTFSRPLNSKRYLITSAQNATAVHEPFLQVLKVAASHLEAEIVVVPIRYKNPTSIWTSQQDHEDWWATELAPYLFNQRRKLNPNLVLAADIHVQPTAATPLSGFESLTGAESCIVAHPKMQFRSVSAPTGRYPKILSTTGSITVSNFTDSKAGALGDFHHYLGAVLVEVKGKTFHLRQINADTKDGSFIDLDLEFTADGVRKAPRALGLNLGDVHARFADKTVDRVTFGVGGIVDVLNPETILWNDLLDGYAANPHHYGNPFISAAKVKSGFGDVRAEVEHAVAYVAARTVNRRSVIVPSNHDNFLARWIAATDWRHIPANASFYLETAQAMLASVKMTDAGTTYADPFKHWVDKLKGDADIRCLDADESFTLAGIECGMHGDKGPNGARGSLMNLSRLGCKVNSGHSHTPGIRDGHYQAGTSTPLRLEYNLGPSSWQNTHIVTYANGKRALLTIIDGTWRLNDSPKRKAFPRVQIPDSDLSPVVRPGSVGKTKRHRRSVRAEQRC
jgi:hypothetical protein